MNEIFEQFARGEIPSALEVLAALNDVSDMWPGNDCLDCRARSQKFAGKVPDKKQRKNNVKNAKIKTKKCQNRCKKIVQ